MACGIPLVGRAGAELSEAVCHHEGDRHEEGSDGVVAQVYEDIGLIPRRRPYWFRQRQKGTLAKGTLGLLGRCFGFLTVCLSCLRVFGGSLG